MRKEIESTILSRFESEDTEQIRILCPICKGGADKELSLSARKDNGIIYWTCWRNKCSAGRGSIILRPADRIFKRALAAIPKSYTNMDNLVLYSLSKEEEIKLYKLWGLTKEQLDNNGVKHIAYNRRIYFPIYNSNGHVVGRVERSLVGEHPKSITFWYNDLYRLHFAAGMNAGPVLLVEDIPSAIRASKFIRSAALIGSNITDIQINELYRVTDHLILALDADTWQSPTPPIKYKKKYGLYFNKFELLYIPKDIKNMSDAEITKRIAI